MSIVCNTWEIECFGYFQSFKTPSCDALTINCWFLYGTMSRSVTKSTWECTWADSGCRESGEAPPLLGDTEEDHTSLKTSTPSIILDLNTGKVLTLCQLIDEWHWANIIKFKLSNVALELELVTATVQNYIWVHTEGLWKHQQLSILLVLTCSQCVSSWCGVLVSLRSSTGRGQWGSTALWSCQSPQSGPRGSCQWCRWPTPSHSGVGGAGERVSCGYVYVSG